MSLYRFIWKYRLRVTGKGERGGNDMMTCSIGQWIGIIKRPLYQVGYLALQVSDHVTLCLSPSHRATPGHFYTDWVTSAVDNKPFLAAWTLLHQSHSYFFSTKLPPVLQLFPFSTLWTLVPSIEPDCIATSFNQKHCMKDVSSTGVVAQCTAEVSSSRKIADCIDYLRMLLCDTHICFYPKPAWTNY